MTHPDIAQQRLLSQHIAEAPFGKPADVVQWLGAVQAQDYAGAKWAVGLRLQGAVDKDIEQALTDGSILRTHLMRPTWHFVSPADIRWLLALTAPRVIAASASWYHKLELDDALFMRSNTVLSEALQGGKQLTRSELATVLQQAGIATDNLERCTGIMMRAELDGIICSGARRGKEFTYALLDERASQSRILDHDEALAELTKRYFTSHGPATLQDFVWWSGLTGTDVRLGLEMVKSQLIYEVVEGQTTYWFSPSIAPAKDLPQATYLLPNYDEYIVGYTDRSAVFDTAHTQKLDARGNVLFNNTIVMGGQVVGTWKRVVKRDRAILTPSFFAPPNTTEISGFVASTNRYGMFLGMPVNAVL